MLTIMLQLISFQLYAAKIQAQISSIDKGSVGEPHLIKLSDGRVAFIEFEEKSLLKQIEKSFRNREWIELRLGSKNTLQSFHVIPPQFEYGSHVRPSPDSRINEPYVPSVVTSTKAKSIFTKMRRDYQKESQCFNRAHIWTFEEFMRSETYTNKVFLFFTSRYIRSQRYHWWFHVTPMVYVGGTKYSNWKMLDRRYTSGPLSPKTWTDIFIKTKRSCKVVYKYSQYRDNQQSQDCYMIPMNMYYLVPSDIERLESYAVERIEYDPDEIEYARWEAF